MNDMTAIPTANAGRQADGRPHAIVIGAGFGGLAAAVRLGARGYRVTVVERLDAPGGRAYVFRQDGFTFDAGPTIITAPYLFDELWALCGRRREDDVDLRPLDPFYVIRFDDGTEFRCSSDRDKMRAEIARLAPEDLDAFDPFVAASKDIYDIAFAELAHVPFHDLSRLVRSVPDIVRLGGYRSVYSLVARFFKNEKTRIAFSFHPLLIGGSPFRTTAYYCLITHLEKLHGVHYAVGGTGALVRGLVGLIVGQGNSVRLGADVEEIVIERGRAAGVKLSSGEQITADIVVSNADTAWTYSRLVGQRAKRRRWTDRKLEAASYSMGLFVWYFGTRRRHEDVYHHTIVLGPRYRGLIDDIFQNKVLAADMSLYLHRPSASDPSLAPEGCDAFYALAPVPNLASGIDWQTAAEPFRQAIERRLEETVLPGFSREVVTSRMMSPKDFEERLLSTNGAGFSFEPRLFQSAWFRPHNRSEDVPGLFFVGAGTHPGAGVPGVLSSAKVLDAVVPDAATLKRNGPGVR
ncbi:MAG: phytoene desaturase family protein [Hyphomicrobium sp.]|nr:phytoene desaturase family protein [Hyphomicrobium sp.]